jgi:hypothetical protein
MQVIFENDPRKLIRRVGKWALKGKGNINEFIIVHCWGIFLLWSSDGWGTTFFSGWELLLGCQFYHLLSTAEKLLRQGLQGVCSEKLSTEGLWAGHWWCLLEWASEWVNEYISKWITVLAFFCFHDQNLIETAKRRKDLFWLMISEIWVHGWLSSIIPTWGRASWQKGMLTSWC